MINEEKWLEYWEKNKIFEKSVAKRKGRKEFVFYEGPPYANGRPGIHHIEARAFKDIILRYKTMKGYYAPRKAGWDTHGLPTEMEVEKKLGIRSKKEIEAVVGIEKFVEDARENVFLYKDEWEKMTHRIAYWLDLKNAYVTMENYYIENLWRIIKEISDKKLLYEDYKVLSWCPRCGTALSHHEVAQGYKNIIDTSVIVKFPITTWEYDSQVVYILSWTTTPWTLTGNVALAVGEDIIYSLIKIKNSNENYILAKNRLKIIKQEYEILKEFAGKDLIGLEYAPLFEIPELKSEKSYKIYGANFVNTEDGAGVVHIAVMYGDDDYKLGKKIGLPMKHTVYDDGKFIDSLKEYGLNGAYVKSKETEEKIIAHLESKKLLFSKENYAHDYPHCWRCQNPLLYYAKNSWFFKTTAIKQHMIRENNTINWRPEYLKKGRFGEWLKDVRDWAISRERYWGTPLPIWKCGECGKIELIGSVKELKNKSVSKLLPLNRKGDLDLHRPYIDKIKLKCPKCKTEASRVKEVVDVWFDSGAMPIAKNYDFFSKIEKDKVKLSNFKFSYPADYICEAIDQTRGWFYTLLAVSSLLGLKTPYKNVISLGLVLDAKGQKMSKSRGNTVNPWEMIEKHGADSVRWYFYTINQPWNDKLFKEKDIEDSKKGFINILFNSFAYFKTYANSPVSARASAVRPKLIINKWLIVKFNNLVKEVNSDLDNYDIVSSARRIQEFVIEDISHWYIRRIRDIMKNEKSAEAKETKAVFRKVLNDLAILIAPFTPFISEEIYLGISPKKQSVHLEDYPVFVGKSEKAVLAGMELARRVASLALEERLKLGIKVRQPLKKLKIKSQKLKVKENKEFLELIKGEVNVKEIIFDKNLEIEVWLDTEITPELKEEGVLRDITRAVQDLRKKAGLTPSDTPSLFISANNKGNEFLRKYGERLTKETKFSKIEIKSEINSMKISTNLKIDDIELNFAINTN